MSCKKFKLKITSTEKCSIHLNWNKGNIKCFGVLIYLFQAKIVLKHLWINYKVFISIWFIVKMIKQVKSHMLKFLTYENYQFK